MESHTYDGNLDHDGMHILKCDLLLAAIYQLHDVSHHEWSLVAFLFATYHQYLVSLLKAQRPQIQRRIKKVPPVLYSPTLTLKK